MNRYRERNSIQVVAICSGLELAGHSVLNRIPAHVCDATGDVPWRCVLDIPRNPVSAGNTVLSGCVSMHAA